MKKIITLLLSVAIVISLFSMIQISAASVPEDGTELAITKADITLIEADGSGDFACSDANSLSYISANDAFSFTVDFAKAGVYKAVAPIAAPAGGEEGHLGVVGDPGTLTMLWLTLQHYLQHPEQTSGNSMQRILSDILKLNQPAHIQLNTYLLQQALILNYPLFPMPARQCLNGKLI